MLRIIHPGVKISGMLSSMKNSKYWRMLKALASLRNKRSWGPFVEAFETTKFDHSFSVSWSQSSEDLALLAVLGSTKAGRYLDIGAHHPTRFSVTRHLFQLGWTGVNVDANSDLLQEFFYQRPQDVSLNYCVGHESEYELSVFNETAISTVNPSWNLRFIQENNVKITTRIVPGISLRELLEKYFPSKGPDLLNIDIEGADFDAITSGDFETLSREQWPLWILVESLPPLQKTLETDTVQALISYGYEIWLVLPFACLLKLERN